MRIFVTGGTSFLGAHIVKRLLSSGMSLTLLVRTPESHPWLYETPCLKIVQGSLTDVEAWADCLQGHDRLIHNALLWDDEPTELQMQDVRASALLFEGAGRAGIKQVIYTSSAAVHRPWSESMSEEDRLQPETTYGATKAANEAFLSALGHQHGFKWTILRPGAVVGAPAFSTASFRIDARIKAMSELAVQGKEIRIQQKDARQFVGAANLAQVYEAALAQGSGNQTYVTVDPDMTQWEGIARRLVSLCQSNSRVILEGPPALTRRFDVTKLRNDLGMTLDSRNEMEHALAWLAQSQS